MEKGSALDRYRPRGVCGPGPGEWDDLMLCLAMVLMYIFLLRMREAVRKGDHSDEG